MTRRRIPVFLESELIEYVENQPVNKYADSPSEAIRNFIKEIKENTVARITVRKEQPEK